MTLKKPVLGLTGWFFFGEKWYKQQRQTETFIDNETTKWRNNKLAKDTWNMCSPLYSLSYCSVSALGLSSMGFEDCCYCCLARKCFLWNCSRHSCSWCRKNATRQNNLYKCCSDGSWRKICFNALEMAAHPPRNPALGAPRRSLLVRRSWWSISNEYVVAIKLYMRVAYPLKRHLVGGFGSLQP